MRTPVAQLLPRFMRRVAGLRSIRTTILGGCLSLTFITILVGVISHGAQVRLSDIAFQIYDNAFMSMSYLRSAQSATMAAARDLASGTATRAALLDQLNRAHGDLAVAEQRALSPGGAEHAQRLGVIVGQMHAALQETGRLPGREELDEIARVFDEAVEINAGDGFHARRAVDRLVEITSTQTWLVIAGSVAAALLITLMLTRAIVPAIRHAVRIASAIAAGQLDNRIEAAGPGATTLNETAALLQALATMQGSIAERIIRFEAALNNMSQGLCMFDADDSLLVHNRRFVEMFDLQALGPDLGDTLPLPGLDGPAASGLLAQSSRAFDCVLDDGRTIAVSEEAMEGGGRVVTYEDVTERHRAEARLSHMARHDALTGLPNRVLFREQIEYLLQQTRRGGTLAVLCLDLDRFKTVNDTLGHPVGDALLRATASRLRDVTRETDIVVRLGGDEFAIIQYSAQESNEAAILAGRLIATMANPFVIGDHQIVIGTSIGIALTTDGHVTADSLLSRADLALYRAKAEGRGCYCFFESEMDSTMQARRRLELDLRVAVQQMQFELYYQPLIDASSFAITGFEALLRWHHPERGIVLPGEFIPLAEETGLIPAIGGWVLNRACVDALQWPGSVKVAVNLSPLQFRGAGLVREVAAALQASGLPAARLELEITETVMMQDNETTLATLHELRALGIGISMDDFGTGYSSLSTLRRFPFDKIKIDRSFIDGLDQSDDSLAIVRAVINLAESLGMSVLAEGVETGEQLDLLRDAGCQQLQGFLFSQPCPLGEVAGLIEQRLAQTA